MQIWLKCRAHLRLSRVTPNLMYHMPTSMKACDNNNAETTPAEETAAQRSFLTLAALTLFLVIQSPNAAHLALLATPLA